MRVLALLGSYDLQRRVEQALSSAHFVLDKVTTAAECSQFTRCTRYEGVLVDSDSLVFARTPVLVRQLRQENPHASLFVFARYLDLQQRLRLLAAGADDCVREPFFASELAVRLGLSIRLHQAASALGASRMLNMLRSGDLELDLLRRRAVRLGKPIVYISALRNKVDRDFPQKLIRTNRGIGYTFTGVSAFPLADRHTEECDDIAKQSKPRAGPRQTFMALSIISPIAPGGCKRAP